MKIDIRDIQGRLINNKPVDQEEMILVCSQALILKSRLYLFEKISLRLLRELKRIGPENKITHELEKLLQPDRNECENSPKPTTGQRSSNELSTSLRNVKAVEPISGL